jgi:hypothetical protein
MDVIFTSYCVDGLANLWYMYENYLTPIHVDSLELNSENVEKKEKRRGKAMHEEQTNIQKGLER